MSFAPSPLGHQLIQDKPIRGRHRHFLEEGLAFLTKEITTVGIVIAEDPTQTILRRDDTLAQIEPLPHQGTMLPLPRCRPVRFRDHVQRQELRQHLGIESIRLAGTLGDDAQLLGMGQNQPIRQRLQQQPQPFVTRGCFHDRLKRT